MEVGQQDDKALVLTRDKPTDLIVAIEKRKNKLIEMESSLDIVKQMNEKRTAMREVRLKKLQQVELKISENKMKFKMYGNSKIELKV